MNLGFLVSGRGSNMLAIISACESGELAATPAVVISNNTSAGALKIASDHHIPAISLGPATLPQPGSLDKAITDTLQEHGVELVILAGYMKKVGHSVLQAYPGRILNIHPSLLPRFGGKGMYGLHVHQAVLNSGEKMTGASVHLVNEKYDQGRILAQQSVPVQEEDTAESLAARVLEVEHVLYVDTIRKIIDGRIKLDS